MMTNPGPREGRGWGRAHGPLLALVLVVVAAAGASDAAALPAPGTLQGRVIDEDEGAPLEGASVWLVRGTEELPDPLGDAELARRAVDEATTDASGVYRFRGVDAGDYVIVVRRLGYRPARVEVTVEGRSQARVSVSLQVQPIALTPLEVRVRGEAGMVTARGETVALGRAPAVRLRQDRYLTSDSRIVTSTDLEESVTLGETDVFRSIQRLPGVTTRDDFSAELWTRGASWGETRVYLDGMPLFNPLHGFGVFSGMSPRGLDAMVFHPGVRPVGFSEGGAAVLDLRSRSGETYAETRGGADVSLASAQLYASGPIARGGWALTARRSYADLVAAAFARKESERLPYGFTDVHGHFQRGLGAGYRLEVTALWQSDDLYGEVPDLIQGAEADWGNLLASASVTGPLGDLRFRQTVGGTWFWMDVRTFESPFDSIYGTPRVYPVDHGLRYVAVRGELAPGATDEDPWTVGYDLVRQDMSYLGPQPWPYGRSDLLDHPDVTRDAGLFRGSVWGRRRWRPVERLTVEAGLRLAAGSQLRTGSMEVAPTASLRFQPTSSTALVAGGGRYFQYSQSPLSIGPELGEDNLKAGRLWTLADRTTPPLDVRIGTLGGEAWIAEGWLASVTGYLRRTRGLQLPDPTPGPLVQRPPFVVGDRSTRGVEASVRKLTGRITGSVGYTLSHARASAVGIDFPAPTDRRHAVDVTTLTRLGPSLRIGVAFTYWSGAPYARIVPCGTDGCQGVVLDEPFQRRSPAYASLDLSLDFTHRFDGWTLAGFLQGRNLLSRENRVTYRHTRVQCPGSFVVGPDGCDGGGRPVRTDAFHTALPTFPLLGLRVTF